MPFLTFLYDNIVNYCNYVSSAQSVAGRKFSTVLFPSGIFFLKFLFFVIDIDTSRKNKGPIRCILLLLNELRKINRL
jgi:hypothetical protein